MHPIENIMQTTMQQLKSMTEVDTIIGKPVSAGNTTILPVSKLSMGFLSGGGEYGAAARKSAIERSAEELTGRYPFAGTAVAGMTITPLAFLSVSGDTVKVLPADYDTTLDRAVELLPEVISAIESAVCKGSNGQKC